MSHSLILITAEAGLTKPDLSLRLYDEDGAALPDPGVTVTEIASGHYQLDGLPEGYASEHRTLTYRTPTTAGARRWPDLVRPPSALVIPFGVSGLTPTTTLYQDTTEDATALTVAEIGSTGDYLITGFPVDTGDWKLAVRGNTAIVEVNWPGAPSVALPRDTTERRLLVNFFLPRWTLSPVAVQGLTFDPDDSGDTAPWTPAQVRTSVGYVVLRFFEVITQPGELSSGTEGSLIVAEHERITLLEVEISIPSEQDIAVDESYQQEVESILSGLAIMHPDPWLWITQLASDPVRYRVGDDNGTWRTSFADVRFLRRERRSLVGLQEVALP